MRALVVVVFAAALSACAQSARDISIAGLDLADGETLGALQKALPVDDRAALGTYALLHWPKSKFYCGQPIGGRVATADTVGEAIALTKAYEAELAKAASQSPSKVVMAADAREGELIQKMERLVLERDMLYGQLGPVAAAATPRGAEITKQLDLMRAELDGIRSE